MGWIMITDEMLKLAEEAYDNNIDDLTDACDLDSLRLALETVAPMLIAQGMREAADYMLSINDGSPIRLTSFNELCRRAQELDPQ